MRELYVADYRNGRGFTGDEWWGAVNRAAGLANLRETFYRDYVDGREPFPWTAWLAKAGWRLRTDTLREPRLGVSLQADSTGLRVVLVDPGGAAAAGGIQSGDVITAVAGVPTSDSAWQSWRQKYARQEGASLPIAILRRGRPMEVAVTVRLAVLIDSRLEVDPAAPEKARRIRDGILRGETTAARPR
jgi:predicted metalloprotease with PDZ domain